MSIFAIGVLTAVIGDLASHFGCFSHIKDSITAITFVALGTSVPGRWKFNNNWARKVFSWYIIPLTRCTNILDTFASKTAAIQDETADASVGNVTGSNAVNVFLLSLIHI